MTGPIIARALIAGLGIAVFGWAGGGPGAATPAPRTIPMTVGTAHLQVEFATTLAERETGLMQRGVLPDTSGMLFVFAGDAIRYFWMKDTPVNLAIAFLDSAKTIINVEEMVARDEVNYHHSVGSARYALEVKEGWFKARGLGPGTKASFTLPAGLKIDP